MAAEQEQHKHRLNRREFVAALAATVLARGVHSQAQTSKLRKVYLVPNMHPASCGWLANFSTERVYCANNYLNHLDRVRDDPDYAFVLSEVNNIIAIMNFRPERISELKQRINEGRVELVNGFFLESTINLSGGEALVRLGVEGLRWYEKVFGARPRFSWNIDVCGTHDQMPQIAAGLGLEALIYTRGNPTGKTMYWSVSPDGTRILTLSPGHYAEATSIFTTTTPLNADQLRATESLFQTKESITPEGAPILVLGGSGDYSLAPALQEYPRKFLKQWDEAEPERQVQFTTLGKYVDAILPGVQSGHIQIPTMQGGTGYSFDAFWIENSEVKTLYRRNEHALQAAEALATVASLHGKYEYPVQPLSDCWVLMCLNMDRNTLWGSAGGMVFVSGSSWDVQDRFNWVGTTADQNLQAAGSAIVEAGEHIGFFNPLNWQRDDPAILRLPAGKSIEGVDCEALPDGSVLCRLKMPAMSVGGWKLSSKTPVAPQPLDSSNSIETNQYLARIDPKTGALASLRFKQTGRELIATPANVIVAEWPTAKTIFDPGDQMAPRPKRTRLATSSDQHSTVRVMRGSLATTVEVTGSFYGGGVLRRVIRFYQDHPRIDFETELTDVPNHTVVVAEFPLAEDVTEVRRGIPYGFSHGAWSKPNPNLHGWTKGIVPAVRWIDFTLAGGGFAIFDRGLSGRELNGRTPILYLLNAEDKYDGYPNSWLSGKGSHKLCYSIVPHESPWEKARIPQMAWEYNREPVVIDGRAATRPQSFLETSDNIIVEAMRREGDHIELRFVECLGLAGSAKVKLNFPHGSAVLTDLTGRKLSALPNSSSYTFPIRPQQIITMHFEAMPTLPAPVSIQTWDRFVPENKRAALHAYDSHLLGHPPMGE